jgi:hypothetical protein
VHAWLWRARWLCCMLALLCALALVVCAAPPARCSALWGPGSSSRTVSKQLMLYLRGNLFQLAPHRGRRGGGYSATRWHLCLVREARFLLSMFFWVGIERVAFLIEILSPRPLFNRLVKCRIIGQCVVGSLRPGLLEVGSNTLEIWVPRAQTNPTSSMRSDACLKLHA